MKAKEIEERTRRTKNNNWTIIILATLLQFVYLVFIRHLVYKDRLQAETVEVRSVFDEETYDDDMFLDLLYLNFTNKR